MNETGLDAINGIGARRKKALLMHFGSAKAVAEAGIPDLQQVPGISHDIAEKIYRFFHDG
jgi:excinuclease ABC subunit C